MVLRVRLPEGTDPSIVASLQTRVERALDVLLPEAAETPLAQADRIAGLISGLTAPDVELLEERIQRQKTMRAVFDEGEWLTADMINALQPAPPLNNAHPATDWKRRGRIFSVTFGNKDYYPRYEFGSMYQPLPVIRDNLEVLGSIADPWKVPAWFHFPNGWIAEAAAGSKRAQPVAPKDALDRSDDVLAEVRRMERNYVGDLPVGHSCSRPGPAEAFTEITVDVTEVSAWYHVYSTKDHPNTATTFSEGWGDTRFAPILREDGKTPVHTYYAANLIECAIKESIFHDTPLDPPGLFYVGSPRLLPYDAHRDERPVALRELPLALATSAAPVPRRAHRQPASLLRAHARMGAGSLSATPRGRRSGVRFPSQRRGPLHHVLRSAPPFAAVHRRVGRAPFSWPATVHEI